MAYTKLTANRASIVSPNDNASIPNVANPDGINNGCALYIGGPGNIKVKTAGGDIITFVGVFAGQFFPVNVTQVFATDTTATDIIALW